MLALVTRILSAVALLAMAVFGFALVTWLLGTRRTLRDRIVPRGGARIWRGFRVMWLRIIAGLLSWPHVLDIGGWRSAPGGAPRHEVWRARPAVLYRYDRAATGGPPVLLVHSLVSSSRVLDLAEGASLIGHLLECGADVFLLEWLPPGRREATMGLRDHAALVRQAQDVVAGLTEEGNLHLVGYCLGALLAAISLSRWRDDRVTSLVTIAAPFDMGVPSAMKSMVGSKLFKPVVALNSNGCVPGALVRESFHIIRARAIRTSLQSRRRRKGGQSSPAARALARWTWEHHGLSGAVLYDQVDLVRQGGRFDGLLVLGNMSVDLRVLGVPMLVAVAARDHIVPVGSSLGVMALPGIDAKLVISAGGHVSMISGADAQTVLWPALRDWLGRDWAQPGSAVSAPRTGWPGAAERGVDLGRGRRDTRAPGLVSKSGASGRYLGDEASGERVGGAGKGVRNGAGAWPEDHEDSEPANGQPESRSRIRGDRQRRRGDLGPLGLACSAGVGSGDQPPRVRIPSAVQWSHVEVRARGADSPGHRRG